MEPSARCADPGRRPIVRILDSEELCPAVLVSGSAALLAIGLVLMLSAETPTTRPNLQTLGLIVTLIGVTALVVVLTIRDPADRG